MDTIVTKQVSDRGGKNTAARKKSKKITENTVSPILKERLVPPGNIYSNSTGHIMLCDRERFDKVRERLWRAEIDVWDWLQIGGSSDNGPLSYFAIRKKHTREEILQATGFVSAEH